jgi:hypothetical protein
MSIATLTCVYDGRQHVGYVLHHLDERVFEAVDIANRSYGVFATHREAAAALPCHLIPKPASATPGRSR